MVSFNECVAPIQNYVYIPLFNIIYINFIVDGGWSEWNTYTQCSVTCGGGTMKKKRHCDRPEPQHGGKNCSGNDQLIRVAAPRIAVRPEECNTMPCRQ